MKFDRIVSCADWYCSLHTRSESFKTFNDFVYTLFLKPKIFACPQYPRKVHWCSGLETLILYPVVSLSG